jgi:hypothetical protein
VYLCKTQNKKDMKDIICVDLTILNKKELKKFSAVYSVSYEALLDLKKKTYAKIWLTKDGTCVAFTVIKENSFDIEDYDTVRMFNHFLRELDAMKSYQVPVEPVILDTDVILDKIFKYGKDSLTLEEKNFLDNL